jgi:hypothetical protein
MITGNQTTNHLDRDFAPKRIRNQQDVHLDRDFDREMFLYDLAELAVEIDRLLLAADHTHDLHAPCNDLARRLKNVAVIHTNVLSEAALPQQEAA